MASFNPIQAILDSHANRPPAGAGPRKVDTVWLRKYPLGALPSKELIGAAWDRLIESEVSRDDLGMVQISLYDPLLHELHWFRCHEDHPSAWIWLAPRN